jgi:predicted Zn-dependent protease
MASRNWFFMRRTAASCLVDARHCGLRRLARRTTAIFVATAMAATSSLPAYAQPPSGKGLPIIRDAEIEQLMRDYTAPILKTAGLAQQNVQVVIIQDRAFNAFVVDGRRIFINVGALLDAKTPNEVIGVLAHESGHLAGGHLAKIRQELANAQTALIIAMLLGVGAAVAGGTTSAGRGGGLTQAGVASMTASPELIRRTLLSYVRSQEEAADRAGVRFLTATQQSPKGMHDTFQRFAQQTLFISQGADPYLMSHPMPRERVEALAALAKASPYWDRKDPPELQERHDLMRAKLSGFLDKPDAVGRRYPLSDTSLAARYARAISAYRFSEIRGALAQIDGLIQTRPDNPYFHELRGQALLENGRPLEAIASLRKAASLAPNAILIRILLGQALIAANEPKLGDEALGMLRAAVLRDPEAGFRRGRDQDGPRTRRTRPQPISDRLARLGQVRRHLLLQAARRHHTSELILGRT